MPPAVAGIVPRNTPAVLRPAGEQPVDGRKLVIRCAAVPAVQLLIQPSLQCEQIEPSAEFIIGIIAVQHDVQRDFRILVGQLPAEHQNAVRRDRAVDIGVSLVRSVFRPCAVFAEAIRHIDLHRLIPGAFRDFDIIRKIREPGFAAVKADAIDTDVFSEVARRPVVDLFAGHDISIERADDIRVIDDLAGIQGIRAVDPSDDPDLAVARQRDRAVVARAAVEPGNVRPLFLRGLFGRLAVRLLRLARRGRRDRRHRGIRRGRAAGLSAGGRASAAAVGRCRPERLVRCGFSAGRRGRRRDRRLSGISAAVCRVAAGRGRYLRHVARMQHDVRRRRVFHNVEHRPRLHARRTGGRNRSGDGCRRAVPVEQPARLFLLLHILEQIGRAVAGLRLLLLLGAFITLVYLALAVFRLLVLPAYRIFASVKVHLIGAYRASCAVRRKIPAAREGMDSGRRACNHCRCSRSRADGFYRARCAEYLRARRGIKLLQSHAFYSFLFRFAR